MFYTSEEINKNLLSEYIYDDKKNVSVKNVYKFQKNIGPNDIEEFLISGLSFKKMSLCRCCFIFLSDDIYKKNVMKQNRRNFNLNFLTQNAKEFGFMELPRSFRFENLYSCFFPKGKFENKIVISDKQNRNVLKICEYIFDIDQTSEHSIPLIKHKFRFKVETSFFSGNLEDCPDKYLEKVFSIVTELIKNSEKYFSILFITTVAKMLKEIAKNFNSGSEIENFEDKQNLNDSSTEAAPHKRIRRTNPLTARTQAKSETDEDQPGFQSPKDIKKELDRYVIGQEKAKKVLSVAVYNHMKRIENPDLDLPKSNIFMVGPTGSGKTYLIEKLGKILNIPTLIYDSTSLTATGYVGNDLDDIFNMLVEKYDGDVSSCEKAIIYLDEIDKVAAKGVNCDVNGASVQQMLLTALEGGRFTANSGEKENIRKRYTIDTSNILFIVGGAFTELEEKSEKSIGFLGTNINEENDVILEKDLIKFGMIREFVGRFSSIVKLEKHTEVTLKRILTASEDSILKKYENVFRLENISLKIEGGAIDEIVKAAIKGNTGARSLKTMLEKIFLNLMYSCFGNKKIKEVKITKDNCSFLIRNIEK